MGGIKHLLSPKTRSQKRQRLSQDLFQAISQGDPRGELLRRLRNIVIPKSSVWVFCLLGSNSGVYQPPRVPSLPHFFKSSCAHAIVQGHHAVSDRDFRPSQTSRTVLSPGQPSLVLLITYNIADRVEPRRIQVDGRPPEGQPRSLMGRPAIAS